MLLSVPTFFISSTRIIFKDMVRSITRLIVILGMAVSFIHCKSKESSNMTASTEPSQLKKIIVSPFGTIGTDSISLFTLKNNQGMEVGITNYGATLTSIITPDKNGVAGDVLLGFNSLNGILQKGNPFFGNIVGRFANRIAGAKFILNGKTYPLAANNGKNTLHGGLKGFDKVIWSVKNMTDSSITLTYFSKDGEEGFPGNLTASIEYSLSADNALKLDYMATTDAPTVINLTNHSYFNLSAGVDSNVLKQELSIKADLYTPVNDELIPLGKNMPVAGGPMDFMAAKAIGRDIDQVKGGYDHNYVLNAGEGVAAEAYDPTSGRVMKMYTTQPGVQFYTGNFLNGGHADTKKGRRYGKHAGFCLETQHYPDSPNQPQFPTTTLNPGETYHQTTVYAFGVR